MSHVRTLRKGSFGQANQYWVTHYTIGADGITITTIYLYTIMDMDTSCPHVIFYYDRGSCAA